MCSLSRWIRNEIILQENFDRCILVIIVAVCVLMIFDDPANPGKFEIPEIVFSSIFIIEMFLKWIALGFWGKCFSLSRDTTLFFNLLLKFLSKVISFYSLIS